MFFDIYGRSLADRAGFDAVIGNPPYVRQEVLKAEKDFLGNSYDFYQGTADLYVFFIELGIQLAKSNARFGVITSNKFIRANYAQPMRKHLNEKTQIEEIIDFALLPVFEGITVRTVILIIVKSPKKDSRTRFVPVRNLAFESLRKEVSEAGYFITSAALSETGWSFTNATGLAVLDKMQSQGIPLSEYLEGPIRFGIKTGLNEVFIISPEQKHKLIAEDPRSIELIRPVIIGSDIRRYNIHPQERYLLWIPKGLDIEPFPAISAYLEEHKSSLKKRTDKGDSWYDLRACTYYEEFFRPKIIYPDIADKCRFVLDYEGLFSTNTAYFFNSEDFYLLAILNSSLSYFYFLQSAAGLEDAKRQVWLRFFGQYMEKFPVIPISAPITSQELEVYLPDDEVLQLAGNEIGKIREILAFLAKQITMRSTEKLQLEQRFWLDLEGVAGDGLAKLQKGKWEESLHKGVAAARPFVRPDSRSTRTLEESLGWNEAAFRGFVRLLLGKVKGLADMVEVYNSYHADYAALVQRIAATDALIDQIVYKLYGLTDEEIAIVEGV